MKNALNAPARLLGAAAIAFALSACNSDSSQQSAPPPSETSSSQDSVAQQSFARQAASTPADIDDAIAQAQKLFKAQNYVEALSVAEGITRQWPDQYGGYYWVAAAHIRRGDMSAATKAVNAAARYSRGLEQEHAALVDSLARHKQALADVAAGDAADQRGEKYLAASKLASAFDKMDYRTDLGERAARLYGEIGDLGMAARYYRRLAALNAGDASTEAQTFLKENDALLQKLYTEATAAGWTALGNNDSTTALGKFATALDADPAFGAITRNYGSSFRDSPYIGLASVAALSNDSQRMVAVLRLGFQNGMRLPADGNGALRSESQALGAMLCDASVKQTLVNVQGPAISSWLNKRCDEGRVKQLWQEANIAFNEGKNAEYVAPSMQAYEKASALYAQVARTPNNGQPEAETLSQRANCNAVFWRAWLAAVAETPNMMDINDKAKAFAACPTPDYSDGGLNLKIAEARKKIAPANMFTLKVCNGSNQPRIWVARITPSLDDYDKFVKNGWMPIDQGKCRDFQSTFGHYSSVSTYLTAKGDTLMWWGAGKADYNACIPNARVDDLEHTSMICSSEELRGMRKVTVTRTPDSNGMIGTTFTFR